MAVALTMQIPEGVNRLPEDLAAEEDDLDLRWLEDRLTWAARLGDAAENLRGCESESDYSDELKRWQCLEETAKLQCEKRRETSKLEKLEKRLHSVSSKCVEAQGHLNSLKRERDLLKDCVQELLLLSQPGSKGSTHEAMAGQQTSLAKGAASRLTPAPHTPRGATPRSARSGGATPNVLTVRHVRFDDKLMESPREPRVPLPAGHVWRYVPILKHRDSPPKQEPTTVAEEAPNPGSARRSPSPTPRSDIEAVTPMDSARIGPAEPMVRQDAVNCGGQVQLPRWAAASAPPAPQLMHQAVPRMVMPGPGPAVVPATQPWLLRQPMALPREGPGAVPTAWPPKGQVIVSRVVQRT